MQVPLAISCPDFQLTAPIDELIRAEADKLERVCAYIISCRVAVERPHRHQQSGKPFRVRIDLRVPHGHEIVVKRESAGGVTHEDLYAVVREVFDVAERQLKKLVAKQHGDIKTHPFNKPAGVVARLYPEDNHGFLEALDGREIYFHRHSLINGDFDKLTVGSGVRFVEEQGDEGPQASTVELAENLDEKALAALAQAEAANPAG
jgi:ribosome-associated translation inhibitor RaiA/cold shock CspA family protein